MSPADRIALLEEEVLQLRRALRVDLDRDTVVRLMDGLRLPCFPARILLALYQAGSRWVPEERLDLALPSRDGRSLDTIKVHICNARKVLGADAILNMRDVGYTLGAAGVLACKRALSEQEAA